MPEELEILETKVFEKKKKSLRIVSGRTDPWWQIIITKISPESVWWKQFCMEQERFL